MKLIVIITILFVATSCGPPKRETLQIDFDDLSLEVLSKEYYIDSISIFGEEYQSFYTTVYHSKNNGGLAKIKLKENNDLYVSTGSLSALPDSINSYMEVFIRSLDGIYTQSFSVLIDRNQTGKLHIVADGDPFP